jgi:DNA polymerase-3 subunit epsilon
VRLGRKLTLGVLGLALPPAAVAALVVVFLHQRGQLRAAPALLVIGLLGLAVTLLYVAVLAHRLGGSLVRAIEALQRGAELMSTVNPDHRLDIRSGDELQALAREINRLAEHLRAARDGFDEQVTVATRELDGERRRLAGVLGELAEGVVVMSADGRVTLANRGAAGLLSDGHALLGRQLGELVDRETIARHLDALRTVDGEAERFTLPTTRGGILEVAMTALPDEGGQRGGCILVLRDPSHPRLDSRVAPEAGPPGRFVGAGLHSGAATAVPGPSRSELYDFSLFDEVHRAATPADRDRRLDDLTFVVFDTETTGLRPESGDRVISLAGVRVRGGQVKRGEIFDALVHPGRGIPSASVMFHGITDAMVVAAPAIDLVLPAFLQFAREAVLVGHEASFDLGFLEPEARRLGLPSLTATHPILDTRLLSRSFHGPGEAHTLEAVALRLGVPVTGRHSALGDALTTAEILVRLVALIQKRGFLTLGQILDAVRSARGVSI